MGFRDFWDFEKPVESEARIRELLAGGTVLSLVDRIEVLSQVARAQGLQSRFDDGHATLNDAERLLESRANRAVILIALERGRLFNSAGDGDRAVTHFRPAFQVARRSGEIALAIAAAHMLGIAAPAGEQLDWNLMALNMSDEAVDPVARRVDRTAPQQHRLDLS